MSRLHTTAQQDIFVLAIHGSTSLARGQHTLFEPVFQWVPRSTATRLVSINIKCSLLEQVEGEQADLDSFTWETVVKTDVGSDVVLLINIPFSALMLLLDNRNGIGLVKYLLKLSPRFCKIKVPVFSVYAFSALTLLVWRQEGLPVCKKTVGCWRGYVSWSRCRFSYDPADVTVTHSVAPVNPDWFYLSVFTFLVPAYPGSPGQNPRGP